MTWCTNATAALREVPFASAGIVGGPSGDGVAEGVVLVDGAASIGSGTGGSAEHAVANASTAARAAYRLRRKSDFGTDFPHGVQQGFEPRISPVNVPATEASCRPRRASCGEVLPDRLLGSGGY
jgi:hypothetical protein